MENAAGPGDKQAPSRAHARWHLLTQSHWQLGLMSHTWELGSAKVTPLRAKQKEAAEAVGSQGGVLQVGAVQHEPGVSPSSYSQGQGLLNNIFFY